VRTDRVQKKTAQVIARTDRVEEKTAQVIAKTVRVQEKIAIRSPKDSLGLKIFWQYRKMEHTFSGATMLNLPDATYNDRDKE